METCGKLTRSLLWIGPLLVALLVAGCAGIKPYEPRDYRQEGLESGLYTGSKGEWVIYRKVDEPETGSEGGNRSDKKADGEQRKIYNEEKNNNGEQ
jgi:hypothetical protein